IPPIRQILRMEGDSLYQKKRRPYGRPLYPVNVATELNLSHSAVHVDLNSGNVRRIFRSEECHRSGHFFGLSKSLHRDLRQDTLCEIVDGFLRQSRSSKDRRNDWAWGYGVYADPTAH